MYSVKGNHSATVTIMMNTNPVKVKLMLKINASIN